MPFSSFYAKLFLRYAVGWRVLFVLFISPVGDPEPMTDFMGFLVVDCKAVEFKICTML